MSKYVIIGNGVAATACIEGIRSVDKKGKITVVSGENHPVYCRPLISYYLEGKTTPEKMNYRAGDFYKKNSCDVLYGRNAVKLNHSDKTVLLDNGVSLPYTSLCVATGSSPFIPHFSGIETVPEKYSFMTLDDAESLKKSLKKDSRVLIVGAGLIGLKCAEGIKNLVGRITVCDLADRILSSILDEECAAVVQHHLEQNGIDFMLSDSVERFEGNTAFMKSGGEVMFDILVLAIGVKANSNLVRDCAGDVNRGIIVDEKMRTSLSDVYSAGDCSEGFDQSIGKNRVLAILPNAYKQGYCAGVNMAGGNNVYNAAIPMNSIGFFGLHVMTAGTRFESAEGGEVYSETTENTIKKLFCKNGFLTGFILINANERAGIYTSMISNRVPLNTVDFELLKKTPTSAAYSRNMRGKIFGGVV